MTAIDAQARRRSPRAGRQLTVELFDGLAAADWPSVTAGSDLLMQLLGLAATVLVLPVAVWGWRLATHRPFDREWLRLMLWLIGTVLALVCAWSITLTDAFGSTLAFRVPFGAIGLLMVGTFICALLATAAPARSAVRIRPAVALRLAD